MRKQQYLPGLLIAFGLLLLEVCIFILIIINPNFNKYFQTNTSQGFLGAAFGFFTIIVFGFGVSRYIQYRSGPTGLIYERVNRVNLKYDILIKELNQQIDDLKLKLKSDLVDDLSKKHFVENVLRLEDTIIDLMQRKIKELDDIPY
jgi:hypothetical protein